MIDRRDLLIAALCGGALVTAEGLRPRRYVKLLRGKLEDTVPNSFGSWNAGGSGQLVVPKTPGSLASKLYSDTITRIYRDARTGQAVMLLVAYGSAQDDLLQLHRPEACYPAVGFQIVEHGRTDVPIGHSGVTIPAVSLTAVSGERVEDIVYWTRLGEALPRSAGEQRRDRLRQAMAGNISDGVLVRASSIRMGGGPDYASLSAFLSELAAAIRPQLRAGLIGSERARIALV